ncbi:NDR1/HIN1-like protein 13 [Salvia hispanica]|uniref:NDR1/HIN1-like protein 13 n=1 Tax=Salvia hispanica TaxID=49212 RepID=UPI0020099DEC|nr:NDR1/HIN1-like protein 13 [Salvia hispanica]
MEERHPPSDTNAEAPIRPPPLPLPPGHETYVVQFPLDNVCRVPPADHARIVEEHTRKTALKLSQPRRRRFRCSLALPLFLIVSVLTLAAFTARSTLYRPLTPSFYVTYIRAYNLTNNLIFNSNSDSGSNSTRPPPEFRVGIRAGNRNPWLTMHYIGGGAASLEFKEKWIARGRAPATINENDEGNANFTVCLAGNGTAALPNAVKERLGSESEKYMELAMDLTVEMRSLLRNEELILQIFCDFKVRHSLAKNAKISWQSCVIGL